MKVYSVLRIKPLFLLIVALCNTSVSVAQNQEEAGVKNMVEAGDYVFKAEMALPMGGRSRYLTGNYDMKVSEEVIETYLPYFGRAYRAPADLTGGGIRFESKDFKYVVKERKKGGWDITIEPNDVSDVRKMSLTVSENGSASLRVTSDRRQSISFTGNITERTDTP